LAFKGFLVVGEIRQNSNNYLFNTQSRKRVIFKKYDMMIEINKKRIIFIVDALSMS